MTDREKLLAEAVAVGLILGADFEKNISNVNLQKKIDEKKAENEANAKLPVDGNNPDGADGKLEDGKKDQENIENKDGVKNPLADMLNEKQKLDDEKAENEEVNIKRVSSCGNYRATIKGYEETARRSGITVEEVKAAIESGKAVKHFTFSIA